MDIKEIKKLFFTYRNGLIADTLRKAGMDYKIIFGLNVPQLSDISRRINEDREKLAEELWNDSEVRESRLLACWLFNPDTVGEGKAEELMKSVKTREEADILAFKLLRYLPFAKSLISETDTDSDNTLYGYAVEALKRNLE